MDAEYNRQRLHGEKAEDALAAYLEARGQRVFVMHKTRVNDQAPSITYPGLGYTVLPDLALLDKKGQTVGAIDAKWKNRVVHFAGYPETGFDLENMVDYMNVALLCGLDVCEVYFVQQAQGKGADRNRQYDGVYRGNLFELVDHLRVWSGVVAHTGKRSQRRPIAYFPLERLEWVCSLEEFWGAGKN